MVTNEATYDTDILVVALGADYDQGATPGLVEGGREFYSVAAAKELRSALSTFAGGTVVIGVMTPHYKCPPAPSEAAMLMHDYLAERGLRDTSRIIMHSPFPSPLPVSQEAGDAIKTRFDERGIEFIPKVMPTRIDAANRTIHLSTGQTVDYDLLLAVPVHVAPAVVLESGLTDDGWISVDRKTLLTRFPDVYAVGDVTSVGTPRAGVFAEGAGKVVAEQIIARKRGSGPTAPYKGDGICYIEFGGEMIAEIYVNFLSGPQTSSEYHNASNAIVEKKALFGSSRQARWFGNERIAR